jgi:uncharacterized protein YoxC
LGHGNYAPKYKDETVVADLDFVHYRKATDDRPPDLIRLQNYLNYQSICLAHNIDDMAHDILQIKQHVSGMHVEFDEQDERTQKTYKDMQELKAKTDIILEALHGLQNSLQGETSLVNSPGTLAEMEEKTIHFTRSSSQRRDKH